jgi:hypothetical protein
MRPHFGPLVNQVRIHTGDAADRRAKALNARAYTAGANIVFRSGAYAPQTQAGRRLLAHEMAHVARPQPGTLMRSAFDGEDQLCARGVWQPSARPAFLFSGL